MFLITGGAGFIGSNVVACLNEAGCTDIVVNDELGSDEKWRNLQKRQVADIVPPSDLSRWIEGRKLTAVIHLGANSDTTATDADAVIASNFRLSLKLLDFCTASRTPFIYASSAATYGDGTAGFDDDWSSLALGQLRPTNVYGWSKHVFDLVVAERLQRGIALPPQCAGLKFFNVFGPNEYHKGHMKSVVANSFADAHAGRPVRLFKSHRQGIADGDQQRDFVYVDDVVAVVRWLVDHVTVSGILNVGTGTARSFRDIVTALFRALGQEPNIVYVDMPEPLRGRYQYYTQARIDRLRRAGYDGTFRTLEASVADYVTRFLRASDRYR